jgi:septal ring factor EnvC (AmiA/AmiB activator)
MKTGTQLEKLQLRELMQQRREQGHLNMPLKQMALGQLKASKSLKYTQEKLKQMETQIDCLIRRVEKLTGQENWVIRLCMQKLSM